MKDGTAEFKTVDARVAAIFNLIYPVGSVFATTGNAPEVGTWEEIAQGRTLQGADSSHAAGSTVEAGLPNIYGLLQDLPSATSASARPNYTNRQHGALFWSTTGNQDWKANKLAIEMLDTNYQLADIGFDASKYASIYGNSTTVQPPAYIVHFYRRVA